jgi:hypothetical protein
VLCKMVHRDVCRVVLVLCLDAFGLTVAYSTLILGFNTLWGLGGERDAIQSKTVFSFSVHKA